MKGKKKKIDIEDIQMKDCYIGHLVLFVCLNTTGSET